jgi:hypothetical protein
MKAIVSMIAALGLVCAFSGSALAGATHCQSSKDCPPSMQCSIKAHHTAGLCVGAQVKKKSFYY